MPPASVVHAVGLESRSTGASAPCGNNARESRVSQRRRPASRHFERKQQGHGHACIGMDRGFRDGQHLLVHGAEQCDNKIWPSTACSSSLKAFTNLNLSAAMTTCQLVSLLIPYKINHWYYFQQSGVSNCTSVSAVPGVGHGCRRKPRSLWGLESACHSENCPKQAD